MTNYLRYIAIGILALGLLVGCGGRAAPTAPTPTVGSGVQESGSTVTPVTGGEATPYPAPEQAPGGEPTPYPAPGDDSAEVTPYPGP